MKPTVLSLIILSLVLTIGTTGCKHNKPRTTPIPHGGSGQVGNSSKPTQLSGGTPVPDELISGQPVPISGRGRDIAGRTQDRETLITERIYFDLDSAKLKKS